MSCNREMGSNLVYLKRTNKLGGKNVTSLSWNRENGVKLHMFPDTSQLVHVIRILWLKLWKAYGMEWLQNAISPMLYDPLDWVFGLATYFIGVESHLKYWCACLAEKKIHLVAEAPCITQQYPFLQWNNLTSSSADRLVLTIAVSLLMVFSEKKLLWWNLIIKEKTEFALNVCTSHKAQFYSIPLWSCFSSITV